MRGRDNGLMDYNSARKFYNLSVRNWTDINVALYEENPQVGLHTHCRNWFQILSKIFSFLKI